MKSPKEMLDLKTRGDFRQLSRSASEGVRRESDTPELADGHPLWELWDTLTEFYGSAFVSQYGDQPSWTWLDALSDLSTADYGVGISKLKTRDSSFPPNPAEFHSLARDNWEHRRQQSEVPRIGMVPLPREQGLAMLAKIREEHGV